jgi:hypothetical protein
MPEAVVKPKPKPLKVSTSSNVEMDVPHFQDL